MTAPAIEQRGDAWFLPVNGSEVWCRDRDVLEFVRDKLSGSVPLLPVAEMDRLYFDGIDLAHLRHPAAPGIFCDEDAPTDAMRGTGSHEEREWAASLRSCRVCVHRAAALRVAR